MTADQVTRAYALLRQIVHPEARHPVIMADEREELMREAWDLIEEIEEHAF